MALKMPPKVTGKLHGVTPTKETQAMADFIAGTMAAHGVKTVTVEGEPLITVETPTVPLVEPQAMTETEALTQEYILLHQKYEAHDVKNLVKRMDDIKKQLQEYANTNGEDAKPYEFTCENGSVFFSERGEKTEVKNLKSLLAFLEAKFGEEVVFSVLTVGLTKLKAVLTDAEMKQFTKK